jgi:hypothetical protein
VSIGNDDQLALGRAVYRDAVRRDDALAAARAAARLRARSFDLGARELETVQASRQLLGRAIRAARARRAVGATIVPVPLSIEPAPAMPARRTRRRPYAIAAVIAALVFLLAGQLAQPATQPTDDGGSGGQPPAAVDPILLVTNPSRGRVVLAVAAVAPAEIEAVATEAPVPVDSPAPAQGAGASPGPSGAASGPGSGGSGSGSGGGSGSGSGGGGSASATPAPRTPTPTPAPTFASCPSAPRGFARLCGAVLDARGQPIAGACVSQGPCKSSSAQTDPRGRFSFTLVVGNGTLVWNLEFAKAGYQTAFYSQTSRQGIISIPTQRLVAAPK